MQLNLPFRHINRHCANPTPKVDYGYLPRRLFRSQLERALIEVAVTSLVDSSEASPAPASRPYQPGRQIFSPTDRPTSRMRRRRQANTLGRLPTSRIYGNSPEKIVSG
jgi:hypothetical protein